MLRLPLVCLTALAVLGAVPETGAAAPALVPVGTFTAPMYVTSPPGDTARVFVVQRAGVIRVVRDGATLAAPFLTIPVAVSTDGERGLLSMAFSPDYATTGRFYVCYTDAGGDVQIDELQERQLTTR